MSVSSASGATVTASLFIPGITNVPKSLVGAPISSDSSGNIVYTVTCEPKQSGCPFNSAFYLTEGASTVAWSSQENQYQLTSVACKLDGTKPAVCTSFATSDSAKAVPTTVDASAAKTITTAASYAAVAITSDADKFKNLPTGSVAGGDSNSANSTSGSKTGGAAASSTSSHAGAVPVSTGAAALGGAMVAMAMAVAAL